MDAKVLDFELEVRDVSWKLNGPEIVLPAEKKVSKISYLRVSSKGQKTFQGTGLDAGHF